MRFICVAVGLVVAGLATVYGQDAATCLEDCAAFQNAAASCQGNFACMCSTSDFVKNVLSCCPNDASTEQELSSVCGASIGSTAGGATSGTQQPSTNLPTKPVTSSSPSPSTSFVPATTSSLPAQTSSSPQPQSSTPPSSTASEQKTGASTDSATSVSGLSPAGASGSSSATSSTSGASSGGSSSNVALSTGAIAGIAIGGAVAGALVIAAFGLLCYRRLRRTPSGEQMAGGPPGGGGGGAPLSPQNLDYHLASQEWGAMRQGVPQKQTAYQNVVEYGSGSSQMGFNRGQGHDGMINRYELRPQDAAGESRYGDATSHIMSEPYTAVHPASESVWHPRV